MTRTNRTLKKRDLFLGALREGDSVSSACKAAGVGRRTAYDWREADRDFALAWDDALEQGTDLLEDVARQRAIDGSDRLLMFLLKARRPRKYLEQLLTKHTGKEDRPTQINIRFVDPKGNVRETPGGKILNAPNTSPEMSDAISS